MIAWRHTNQEYMGIRRPRTKVTEHKQTRSLARVLTDLDNSGELVQLRVSLPLLSLSTGLLLRVRAHLRVRVQLIGHARINM